MVWYLAWHMKNYFRLLQFLKDHKKLFFIAIFLMAISSFFEGFQFTLIVPLMDRIFTNQPIVLPQQVPGFVRDIVDTLNQTDRTKLFWMMPLGVFLILFLKNFIGFWYGYIMNSISQRVIQDIRNRLYDKILSLSLDYFSVKRSGELISRITNDVLLVENAISYGTTDMFRQPLTILIFVAIIFMTYAKAAFIIFLIFPLIAIPMSQIGRKLRKLSKSTQENMADINSHLLETITGIRVVKAFCAEEHEIKKMEGQNREFYKLKMKAIKRFLLINPLTEMMGAVCGIIMIVWLGKEVMEGKLSTGVFILFFGSFMSLISPIKKISNVNAITQQALAANERIYEVLDAKPTVVERPSANVLPVMKDKISLEQVFFQYDAESGLVLKDINLEIKKGELVAIVGPTGTGKSTLASLVPRFYDSTKGAVKIDGINLREVSFTSLRGQIGIVAQETILFNDTVKNNIAYGHRGATQSQIEEAAKKAYAHQFIIKMPKGYETVVGDRGFRLSGGEKQRISIARAILKNPPILILDEATSHLDSESEKYVQEALDKLMQGRTVIAIAHRLSTIKKADKIVVLEHGRIVGMGKHDQLLQTCNLYSRLYQTQFQE